MREIKFRAWNTVGNCMVDDKAVTGELGFSYARSHPDKYKLMEYTGLHDVNGTEIYEGDIVRHFFNGQFFVDEVTFKRATFILGQYHLGYAVDGEMAGKAEVIGNTYENPELLK